MWTCVFDFDDIRFACFRFAWFFFNEFCFDFWNCFSFFFFWKRSEELFHDKIEFVCRIIIIVRRSEIFNDKRFNDLVNNLKNDSQFKFFVFLIKITYQIFVRINLFDINKQHNWFVEIISSRNQINVVRFNLHCVHSFDLAENKNLYEVI